jgi:hypothetical protein
MLERAHYDTPDHKAVDNAPRKKLHRTHLTFLMHTGNTVESDANFGVYNSEVSRWF